MITITALILYACGYGHIASMCILACLITNLCLSVLEVMFKIFPSNPMQRPATANKILSGCADLQDYLTHIFVSCIGYTIGTLLLVQKIPLLYIVIFALIWLILCI